MERGVGTSGRKEGEAIIDKPKLAPVDIAALKGLLDGATPRPWTNEEWEENSALAVAALGALPALLAEREEIAALVGKLPHELPIGTGIHMRCWKNDHWEFYPDKRCMRCQFDALLSRIQQGQQSKPPTQEKRS